MKSPTLVSSSFGLWLLFASSLCTFSFCIEKNTNNILCKANERSVLLEFKRNLIDYNNRLSSWSGEDCCRWCGVVCDKATGHVHEIRLRGPENGICSHSHDSKLDDKLEKALKLKLGGIISPSLIKLKELKYLDLSYHNFISREIPTFIGSFVDLKRLQDLDEHGIKLARAASDWQQIFLPNHLMSQNHNSKTNKGSTKASNGPQCPIERHGDILSTFRASKSKSLGHQGGSTDEERPGYGIKRSRDEHQLSKKKPRA